ncbi:MAG: patatin-like phospholipase family protein, partial [Armatimonadota bacterium]
METDKHYGMNKEQTKVTKHMCATGLAKLGSTIFLLIVFLLSAYPSRAQAPEPGAKNRPKIGLALGGGGARGFAHIGVLRWFEEHHIPVDMIAGTSMGGLVGGMYAIGMTPGEMQNLTVRTDWDKTLGPGPAYQDLTFRRKEDRRDLQSSLQLGLRKGLSPPPGLQPGHQVKLLLDRLTLAYSGISSFDQLPIPFRCVATDMEAAEPVVLSDGSLSQALRATMAIPGVFTPVERDGKILADGFLLNNVPTDVLKAMGADIIIAVDIGTPLGDKESMQTLTGMLGQSWGVMTIQNVRRNLRLATIILSPDLEKFTSNDYRDSAGIEALGYEG